MLSRPLLIVARYVFLLSAGLGIFVLFQDVLSSPSWELNVQLTLACLTTVVLNHFMGKQINNPWFNPKIPNLPSQLRRAVKAKSELHFDGRVRESEILDISDGGCFMRTDTKLMVGEDVKVHITLQEENFHVEARVQWVNRDPHGYGLRFTRYELGTVDQMRKAILAIPPRYPLVKAS